MKKTLQYLLLFTLSIFMVASAYAVVDRETIFQTSTLNALTEGVYDGNISIKELKKYGDFGIGTFEGLDGEMCEVDRKFYQIKSDGHVYAVDDKMMSPFAAVTYFDADKKVTLDQPMDYKQLQAYIENMLPTRNIMYAFRIEGNFTYIKTRSVPKQSKPYPKLAEVVKTQPTFEMENVKGTILGYWLPQYLNGVNMPGFHFHFLTSDKKAGGHLLECRMTNGSMAVDYTFKLNLVLPEQSDFYKTDLTKDKKEELEGIEK
jgi:acetolactate decarboxylase